MRNEARQFIRYAAVGFGVLVLGLGAFSFRHRADKCVLFYYGASPEVPQGTAVAILNPFRNRHDEALVEKLIRDLRTDKCAEIARKDLDADPERLCSVLREATKANLIWLDPPRYAGNWQEPRALYYDLPVPGARLAVYFHTDEGGWGISGAGILH